MELKITCKAADCVNLDDLVVLQGNLKELSFENYDKLKGRIIERGFSFPFFVWKDQDDINWILDGTHRKLVLTRMRDEGWTIPPLPVAWVEAKDIREAKAKLLEVTSSYAKITDDGLAEFIADLDFRDIVPHIQLPDFNIDQFVDSHFVEDAEMPPLSQGGRDTQQMTFTLSNEQVDKLKEAMEKAKDMGPLVDEINQNQNGNAIARVAEVFISGC